MWNYGNQSNFYWQYLSNSIIHLDICVIDNPDHFYQVFLFSLSIFSTISTLKTGVWMQICCITTQDGPKLIYVLPKRIYILHNLFIWSPFWARSLVGTMAAKGTKLPLIMVGGSSTMDFPISPLTPFHFPKALIPYVFRLNHDIFLHINNEKSVKILSDPQNINF